MQELPLNIWLVSDFHGVLAKEKEGEEKNTQLVDHPITEEFLQLINNLANRPEIFTYPSFLREVFSGSEYWSLELTDPLFNPTQRLVDLVLTNNNDEETNHFFNGFEIPPEIVEGVSMAWENSIDITICTGIPFNVRGRFIQEIAPILGYLHSSLPAILRPTDLQDISKAKLDILRSQRLFSASHFPMTTGSYVKIGVGKAIQTFSPKNTLVAAYEDDTYVARCLSRALGIRVYNPLLEDEALSQPHLAKLSIPASLQDVPDNIVYGYSLVDVLKDLKSHG